MPNISVPLVGGSYESRSLPISAQRTVNYYPEPVPQGRSPSALMCWPGAKQLFTVNGANRGIINRPWKGAVYFVNGSSLYKMTNTSSASSIGSIPGTERCLLIASNNYVYIVTGGLVYRSDGATVSTVTDTDLETPNSAAFLSSFVFYDGDSGRFWVSDAGDGGSIGSLSFATAESLPDDLLMVYAFRDVALMAGSQSIEPWYVSGSGTPPVDKIQGGTIPVGVAGSSAMTNSDAAVYFVGSDRAIYRIEGYNAGQVSTPALNNALDGYDDISDVFCFHLKLQGQSFVVFQFPSANSTWVLSETHAIWFELETSSNRHLSNGHCYAFGKHIIPDYRNGNICWLDLNTYSDNGDTIIRERTTAPITSRMLGEAGRTVFYNSVELVVNAGNGLATGQGSSPQVMMDFSDDGGMTWSSELWASSGVLGAYGWRLIWYNVGYSMNRVFRFRVSDPVEVNLLELYLDLEVGY